MRRTEYFYSGRTLLDTSTTLGPTKTRANGYDSWISGKANDSTTRDTSQLFKIPNVDTLPVRRGKLRAQSFISPRRRVQSGRVKNDSKVPPSKMSFRPCTSFLNPNRRTLSGSTMRTNNARKDLIKKMVYLAECALKDNKEMKQSTPVKNLPGLTPRKTPKAKGYLVLPEFFRNVPNISEKRSPSVRRDILLGSSVKFTPGSVKKKFTEPADMDDSYKCLNLPLSSPTITDFSTVKGVDSNQTDICQILNSVRVYSTEASEIYNKLRIVEDNFESNVLELPEIVIFEKFQCYLQEKRELHERLRLMEEELASSFKERRGISDKLKLFISEKREVFEKQMRLHKEFESVILSSLEKYGNLNESKERVVESKREPEKQAEVPKLRRSLRLSKLPKKVKEGTPGRKKLVRLDTKSRGIQKTRATSTCKTSKVKF